MDSLTGWQYEDKARSQGYSKIAGVDEAGRGPLAGPVVAAAVVLPTDFCTAGITDSKKLSDKQRRCLSEHIYSSAESIGIGIIGAQVIDEINILKATHKAMKNALDLLNVEYDYVLVDGLAVPGLAKNCRALVKGDVKSVSIAAASIIAKVTRDNIMLELHKEYPMYGFASHYGYGTRKHREALKIHGPCPYHRMSFAPLKEVNDICVLPGLD